MSDVGREVFHGQPGAPGVALGRIHRASRPGGDTDVPGGPLIVTAIEVTADDLLMTPGDVAGAASVVGGATGHAATVARALGIPIVFGLPGEALAVPDGVEALLDGATGRLTVAPGMLDRAEARDAIQRARLRRGVLAEARTLPTVTLDGHPVGLQANVGSAADAGAAVVTAAEGVGLVRTELPFLSAARWPTVDEHLDHLVPVLRPLAGLPVTVRTLDFADDKLPPFLAAGLSGRLGRGLPLMLAAAEAFSDQFEAVLRAAAEADVQLSVMIPMVADVSELRACRKLLEAAAAAVGVPAPPLGAMIELPEAVESVEEIAAEADFLSLGTNDLTAAILGIDRRDPALTARRTADPPVLAAIAQVCAAGRGADIPVTVCGDAAADPWVAPLLIGAGCTALSVTPAVLDEVRALIRGLDFDDALSRADAVLESCD
ncbi:putative PEP-binding protein [Luedemannella flava]